MTAKLEKIDTGFQPEGYLEMAARSGRILAEMSGEGSELIGHVAIGIYSDGTFPADSRCRPTSHLWGRRSFAHS